MWRSLRAVVVLLIILFSSFFLLGSSASSSSGSARPWLASELASSTEPPQEIIYIPPEDGLSSGTDGGVIIITLTTLPTESTTTETTTTTTEKTTTTITDTTTTSTTQPDIGSKITSDYKAEKGAYNAVFSPDGSGVEVSAYGVPLQFKPLSLKVRDAEAVADVSDLHYSGVDKLEYQNVFGGKGRVEYQLDKAQLKEAITFDSISDLPTTDSASFVYNTEKDVIASSTKSVSPQPIGSLDSLASATSSVEFLLTYPNDVVPSVDGTVWDGRTVTTKGDIIFVRKMEPHMLYTLNQFYTVVAPFIEDASHRRVDLTYTLIRDGEDAILRLEIPPISGLEYPVTIDPTIVFDITNDNYEWYNTGQNCSTNESSCMSYGRTNMDFTIPYNCKSQGTTPVSKPFFRFNTSNLKDIYPGIVDHAELYVKGSCSGQSSLHSSPAESISLYVVGDIGLNPSCEGAYSYGGLFYPDVMTRDNCSTWPDGIWIDVKYNFSNAVNNRQNLSFKIDNHPWRNKTDQPSSSIVYNIVDDALAIRYAFRCANSSQCPASDFCNDTYMPVCDTDLAYNASCDGVAVDNDSLACQNGNCQIDDFDGSGKYCTETGKCVNDAVPYDPGYVHCNSTYGYKTCQDDTLWSSYTPCDWTCNETIGCVTTTTLAPNIQILPSTLTYRRNVR
jgi:hypothetical protein